MKTAAALIALAGAGLVVGMSGGQAEPVQWEYRLEPRIGAIMDPPARDDHDYQKFFDALGRDGWEYVGPFGGGEGRGPKFALVFKRVKR